MILKRFVGGLILALLFLTACQPPTAGPTGDGSSGAPDNSSAQTANDTGEVSDETAAETAETADSPTVVEIDTSKYAEFEIITLLPPDAIRAIDNPQFLTAEEARDYYDPDELVIGVEFDGDARAYSVPHLSSHEIVNDTVGGVKIAVTW